MSSPEENDKSPETAFNDLLGTIWCEGLEPTDMKLTMPARMATAIFGVNVNKTFDYMSDFGKIRISIKGE